jgi:hypothetical protein
MMAKNFRSLKRIRPSDDRSCIVCFTAYRYNCFLLGVAKVGSGVFIGVEDGFAKALPKNRPVGVTTGIYLVMNSLHSVENIVTHLDHLLPGPEALLRLYQRRGGTHKEETAA